MAWYGDVYLQGERKSDIKSLADEIEKQQKIYLEGMGKKEKREKGRRLLMGFLKNPMIDKQLYESDKKEAPKWMRKLSDMLGYDLGTIDYGDPEAIKKLETHWTTGRAEDYGEELEEMQDEGDIPYWETFLNERKQEFDIALQLLPLITGMGGELPQVFGSSPATQGYLPSGGSNLTGGGNLTEIGGESYDPNNPWNFQQGGQVPKKYYGGGSVSGSPTIVDYFSRQGKTLGGSNIDSLAKRLGRT